MIPGLSLIGWTLGFTLHCWVFAPLVGGAKFLNVHVEATGQVFHHCPSNSG